MSKKYLAVMLFLSTVILSGCTSILWALNNPMIIADILNELKHIVMKSSLLLNTKMSI